MTTKESLMTNTFCKFYLSAGGIGYFPVASGTLGSLAAIPLIYLSNGLSFYSLMAILILLTALATVSIGHLESKMNVHDPSWIVIDEVLGMFIAWVLVGRSDPISLVFIFIFFRFFDIFKFWPANFFDRQQSSFSVIADDLVSGLYAAGASVIVLHLTNN